jgi:polysaccharide export outer membrane protein
MLCILVFVLASTFGFSDGFAAERSKVTREKVSPEYIIGPQNVLQIDVYYGRDKNLERKVRVSSKGYINFPLLGEVEISGLTVNEAVEKLAALLEKDYLVNPQVSIFIEEYSTVSVIGQVNKPGTYPIKGRLTVVEAISLAEGFTKIAAPNGVKVLRTNSDGVKTSINIKAGDIINGGKKEDDLQLQSGDIVSVPESFF